MVKIKNSAVIASFNKNNDQNPILVNRKNIEAKTNTLKREGSTFKTDACNEYVTRKVDVKVRQFATNSKSRSRFGFPFSSSDR